MEAKKGNIVVWEILIMLQTDTDRATFQQKP